MDNQVNNSYNVKIDGNVSGKIAVGSNIIQVSGVSTATGEAAEDAFQPLPPGQRQELKRVRHFLARHFNVDELHELAVDLGIDYEDLAGASKRAKVRDLVQYVQRQGLLDELVEVARARRPLVAW